MKVNYHTIVTKSGLVNPADRRRRVLPLRVMRRQNLLTLPFAQEDRVLKVVQPNGNALTMRQPRLIAVEVDQPMADRLVARLADAGLSYTLFPPAVDADAQRAEQLLEPWYLDFELPADPNQLTLRLERVGRRGGWLMVNHLRVKIEFSTLRLEKRWVGFTKGWHPC